MLVRRQSLLAMLLVLLSLLLIFQNGAPNWFGPVQWAIVPLNTQKLPGVLLGAFVHGSWDHLWGNLFALIAFSTLFLIQFPTRWFQFWLLQHIIASFLLWLIGSMGVANPQVEVAHIGASIWVYAFGGFILTMGILQRTKQSMSIFFLVLLLFGGFFWGLLPVDPKVSWQGHLSGLITGVLIAIWKGKSWLPQTQVNADLSNDEADQDDGLLEDPYQHL